MLMRPTSVAVSLHSLDVNSKMLKKTALGMVETIGLIGTAEAADAMSKAASVSIETYEKIGNGYTTTLIRGGVGAVETATRAGEEAARRVGAFISSHVIPKLHPQVEKAILNR